MLCADNEINAITKEIWCNKYKEFCKFIKACTNSEGKSLYGDCGCLEEDIRHEQCSLCGMVSTKCQCSPYGTCMCS